MTRSSPPAADAYCKSSFSADANGCVEVATTPDGDRWVRDTKDRTRPPHRYAPAQWAAFLAGVRRGEFTAPR